MERSRQPINFSLTFVVLPSDGSHLFRFLLLIPSLKSLYTFTKLPLVDEDMDEVQMDKLLKGAESVLPLNEYVHCEC